MLEFLVSALFGCVKVIDFILDLLVCYDRMRAFARSVTGSDRLVEVPADPKELPPAARRALAEAEERERRREAAT